MNNNLDKILEKPTDATLESIDEQLEISHNQQPDTNADVNDNLELIESKMSELQNELDKIDEGIEKVNECLNKKDENDKIVLSQGYTTFNWLMNNMDKYWTDMEGSVRNECMEYYKKLNDESTGPIAVVKAEASNVLAAAEKKKAELHAEKEDCESELENLRNSLASLQ